MRQAESAAVLPDLSHREIVLTVHGDHASRLGDPNERHRVQTRFSRKGQSRREGLELHSAHEEPLEQGTAMRVSTDPKFTVSPQLAVEQPATGELQDRQQEMAFIQTHRALWRQAESVTNTRQPSLESTGGA